MANRARAKCQAAAETNEAEGLRCVLAQGHVGSHIWRHAACRHQEQAERLGLCEHDHKARILS